MSSPVKKIYNNKFIAKLLLKPVLKTHSFCYKLAGRFGIILNDGLHPKHNIIKYKQWFLSNIQPGWTVLDVGSNTGMLAVLLADKAEKVYAIEIDQQLFEKAKQDNTKDKVQYICADASSYDYSSTGPIDCIIMSNVLEHIENRIEFLKTISQNVRWADENNKMFLFRVPAIDREWIVIYKKDLGLEYRLDPTHYVEYTLDQFREELKKAGIIVQNAEVRFGEIYVIAKVE